MGMRIHEIRKKYNLSSKQMNDFLSSIGYTGSTNALMGLPDNIIEKIEKHFAAKSSLSDSSIIIPQTVDCSTKQEENSNNSENNRNSLDLKQNTDLNYIPRLRIYEAKKIFNLNSEQMNEVLTNIRYTGSRHNLCPLSAEIVMKVEKYLATKSDTTDLYNTKNVVHSSIKSTTEVNQNTLNENFEESELFRPIYKGEIVTGTVIDKNTSGIYVDLGYTSDGLVPAEEFEQGEIDKFNVGDLIKVYFKKIDDKQGQVQLSYRIALKKSSWDELEEAYKNKTPVEGVLKERIKCGYIVNILGDRAFLPQSQLSAGMNIKENISKPFQMMIIEFDRKKKNIVVSERAIHEVIRNKKLDKYHVGDIFNGKVKKIVNYGVFVELEEDVDGLLHNSNISSYQKEILEEGQTVKVKILNIDSANHRLSLKEITDLKEPSNIYDCSLKQVNLMKKTFVLDTNVILVNHEVMFSFQEHNVVIPMCVIDELDNFKKCKDNRGYEAREFSRYLKKLSNQDNFAEGVKISTEGILQVMIVNKNEIENKGLDPNIPDNQILACTLKLKETGKNPVLVSNDKNLCIKANTYGIQAECYETNKINLKDHSNTMELNEKESNNNYPNNKLKYDISEYKEIEMVDFLIDYMHWLNKKILIKNILIKNCSGFRLSIKQFLINYNSDYIYCSFDGLDKEKIIELNNIFHHFNDYYNKSINLYCVVQEGYVTKEDVSEHIIFFKLDKFTINLE